MKNVRRRPQQKHLAQVSSHTAAPSHPRDPDRLRPSHGVKTTYDFESTQVMLEDIQHILDNAKDCKEISPALDQLVVLSGQHPNAWKPHFKSILDLLVGWHTDRGTNETVRRHIADALSSFSAQWREVAGFGQDLLEYFIKDIDTVIMDSTPSDLLSSIDIIRLLLSSFDIIAKALIAHASQELDRIVHIQQRAVSTLTSIRKLSSSLDAAGNEIILALSLAEPSTFYNQQPVAIHYLASQFENTQIDNATWTQKITILRKILAAWKPRMHPNVTLEAVHPKGDLMRLRWLLPMKSTCAQDLLDIILLCVPGPAVGASLASHEYADTPLQTWSSVMYEVDAILQSLALGNCLSETESLGSVIEAAEAARKNELENSRLIGTKYHGTQRADCRRTGASTNTSISNMTFDILLLVEMAKLWPSEADLIFIRLLGTLDIVPESRLAIVIQALREISASQEHFIPDWLNVAPATSIDTNSLDVTTAGISLKAVQTLVAHWKLFPLSIKLCIVIWGSGILQAMRPYRDASSASRSWVILKRAISSNLHQLITIAGADEDELVRGSIAIIFESFIGTFGSFSLGPQFLATMTDRSLDISPIAGAVWKRVAFQANPFSFAFQCYDIPETDIIRALKTLVLRSPNSGVFRYPHFSTVFSALAAAEENLELIDVADNESTGFPQDGDMLQRLFHSCQGQDILAKVNSEYGTETIATEQLEIFQHSFNLLRYWSLWETARYCVLSRLRTPFGGPQQTLDALEKQLNALMQSDQKYMGDASGIIVAARSRQNKLRDFLSLLDRIELQFYNAQQGTALGVIPLAPKPSIMFVRSNKKMLDDWLSRIRSRVVAGARAIGEHEIIIRNGYMLLVEQFNSLCRGAVNDILPWLDEFERVLVYLVEALVATNSSDAISGLYVWCRRAIKDMTRQSNSSRSKTSRSERSTQYPRYRNACLNDGQALALSQVSLDWINVAVLHAQNRYEQSAKEAMSLMGSFADNESAPANFLCQGISNSLSDLYSYQQLQKFMDSISIETFAKQTMLWSDDTLTLSLKEYCSNEGTKAWKYLEGFYGTFGKERTTPDMFAFDRSGLVGRNYLFATKVHQQSGLQPIELDRIRQQALHILEPSAEFLMYNGLEHASATLLDAMMLKTATSATPLALKEFMDQLALVPDELRMNMFHKDLRYWVRLDALVNLAKRQVLDEDSLVRKQSNEFKFLLSKIARRSECHDFASSITRTWEGALSPEIQFEEAKAAVAKHDYSAALSASNRILGRIQSSTQTAGGDQTMAVFQSKIYLKMAKWSRSTKPQLSEGNIMAFEDILSLEHETTHSVQARVESITATCLQKAIEVGTNYRKSWFAYGTHHYKQGWGILDELGSFRFHHPVAMVANDTLKSILERSGVEKLEEHSKDIFCVFVKHCASGQPFDEPTVYESIRVHLLKIDEIAASENAMVEIVKLFQTLLQQILEAYRLAIHGYFRFLQFAALEFECHKPKTKTTSGEEEAEIELSHLAVSDEITATLRLLRLLAKHGGQLYDAFHENLVGINVSPWANIIPQLFARLDHPEKPVQTLIADLLCKIGEQYPQLIVFHCVVGANSAHNSACQRRLLCSIGDFLNKSHPELVLQVQHLIRELERITVLWEEVWYKKMMAGLPELKNTLQELTEQYQGLDAISGLSVEDKDAVMSDNYQQSVIPLLATFESLQDSNATPESNHERWFISMFRSRIQEALECLRSPKAWSNLFEGLGMLKEIYIDLGKELSGTRVLQLSNLSPELASIQSSLIDIPSPSHESGVTIQSFEQQVVVIPTKTKPKKLTLVGSDGKRYTYLFKGLEDLHLDERVMQLLRITNGMLQRDKESNSRQLSARHYAVVPLSDNSGMIQWVENTVSIFTIIAKWQHRELMWARWMNDDTPAGTHQAPQRATEIYHEKAAAALKRAGQPSNLPRRQWPKSMLLDLYHEMANETPADLLEREIWTSSPTAEEWWRKSVRFARSTAVMSMIGYVIGLGDRHLDNILIDFTTGDLVHIDYNVCFEKGKRLRIPEIVPFRLSRNMLTSLGVTGVEGNFRIGCEQTMKVMRKNKEILVTLLEAFVYDPLVDWQIEATAPQGGAGGAGVDVGQGHPREGHHGLAAESESESSNISGVNQQDSRSSFDNSISTRSRSSRRRMSNESLASISSISIKSTATVDSSSKRWSTTGGDQAELTPSLAAMNLANGTSVNQAQQQQHQGQQIQPHQRNAYAVHILRRVRHKLEGRDFEAVKKCKVTEQVDRVIQEATSVDNLANMYEGWTPWL
ncbi:hypothetical protein BC939DRAFT_443330 [Gamsiella multidivaricata]|uniref:uncharacterized protein n=1 Tax=Gamsiella multidivaricata TaxID=101098 RepID=UPI002220DBC5|nr:uncharacterized protein BC939DRAFT_443330 [Gamsiella multidivaricata]KAI7828584.1 hypothetical protein BC939DRAFT_443330 [Gamsiella multidivaricata]